MCLGLLAGCSASSETNAETSQAPVTNITPSDGVQQTIGDCWDMTSSAWLETLSKRPTNATPVDISEAYVSYLHWYRQIRDPQFATLKPEGNWGRAVELIRRYGWMSETDFLSQSHATNYAARHAEALAAVKFELAGGDLATPELRADHANVVKVLNRVWQLTPAVTQDLATAMGPGLDNPTFAFAGTRIHYLHEIRVGSKPDGSPLTALDVVGQPADLNNAFNGQRVGPYAWSTVLRPLDDTQMRGLYRTAQKALYQDMPVPVSLMLDDKQDDPTGTFVAPANGATLVNPSGHMVLAFDLSVQTPNFGLLPAGTPETRPDALADSLSDDAKVLSFRVRNSFWGSYTTVGQTIPSIGGASGINDFSTDYLAMRLAPTDDDPRGTALLALTLPMNPDQVIGK
jgi:hypothetical protein